MTQENVLLLDMVAILESQRAWLEGGVDRWIDKAYGHTTLAGGVHNMHTPEGPPALRAQILKDVMGVLDELNRASVT